jgi:hypothetical protein
MFHGFDGLTTLSRREGVDIRPTLLRVLTDLYVQSASHTIEEDQQFSELASRLIDEVDDATRAAIRARLSVYPATPREIRRKLGVPPPPSRARAAPTPLQFSQMPDAEIGHDEPTIDDKQVESPDLAPGRASPVLSLKSNDATALNDMFASATSHERVQILHNLSTAALRPAIRLDERGAQQAAATLEQAAMNADVKKFTAALAEVLILPVSIAANIVNDVLGEPLACAMKIVGMPSEAFQRVLLFLNPARGQSVMDVYRLSRLYDTISERSALIMLAAWRGSSTAVTRAKYRATLYDDERQRARPTPVQARPSVQPGTALPQRNLSRSEG